MDIPKFGELSITSMAVISNSEMEEIFSRQLDLMIQYDKKENWPAWGKYVNLQDRTTQKVIRDFTGRFVEELAEAYDVYWDMVVKLENNKLPHTSQVLLLNEEMADAHHFIVEILLFCGVSCENLRDLVQSRLEGHNLPIVESLVGNLLAFARYHNTMDMMKRMENSRGLIPVHTEPRANMQLGKKVSSEVLHILEVLMWRNTHKINMARNKLKGRAWRVQSPEVNTSEFISDLLDSLIMYYRIVEMMDGTRASILFSYLEKNEINRIRIQTGY